MRPPSSTKTWPPAAMSCSATTPFGRLCSRHIRDPSLSPLGLTRSSPCSSRGKLSPSPLTGSNQLTSFRTTLTHLCRPATRPLDSPAVLRPPTPPPRCRLPPPAAAQGSLHGDLSGLTPSHFSPSPLDGAASLFRAVSSSLAPRVARHGTALQRSTPVRNVRLPRTPPPHAPRTAPQGQQNALPRSALPFSLRSQSHLKL